MYYNTILTSRDLTRYFNVFLFIRKIEAVIKIQRWWRRNKIKKRNLIENIVIR